MIEARALERLQPRLGQPHTRSDQVDVVAERVRLGDDRFQVIARQRLTAGQPQLDSTQGPRLAQYTNPILGCELGADDREVSGVVTYHAGRRSAVSQLEQQPQRRSRAVADLRL